MAESESTSRRVLVIDDDPAFRTTVAFLLQRLGYTVHAAESGSAGIALLRQRPVDVVLTDLLMPGLTGWDVGRLVKAMHPRLPVVLVTGAAHTIDPDQPERRFVDAILAKPVGLAAMQAVIGPLALGLSGTVGPGGPQNGGRPTVHGEADDPSGAWVGGAGDGGECAGGGSRDSYRVPLGDSERVRRLTSGAVRRRGSKASTYG